MHDHGTPTPTGEIHPAAAIFPMLPDDELAELAADIKANGLLHPIVLDDEGALIDGRNRLAACRLAGVEPTYAALNGHDPVTYILSANVARRNLSKGQRAMAVAVLCSVSEQTVRQAAITAGLSTTRVANAVVVRTYAPELEPAVMSGALSLDDAYTEARQRKEAQASREEQVKRAERDLAVLRAGAPDLAELVAEERMSLPEAMAARRQREADDRRDREDMTRFFSTAIVGLWSVVLRDPARIVDRWLPDASNGHRAPTTEHVWTSAGLRDLARSLETIADGVDAQHGGSLR